MHTIIRHAIIAASVIGAAAPAAHAQTREPRVTLSGLVQQEIVRVDGGEGTFTAIGAGVDVRLLRFLSLHGELTAGSGDANDAYEGIFFSIAPPNSSREEIERLGVHMQRFRNWTAGLGGAVLASFHTPPSQQVGVILSVGAGFRELELTDELRVTRLPEGWDPSRSTGEGTTVNSRQRGGPIVALAIPVRLGPRFSIAPEGRLQFTIADEDYTVGTIGMRARWSF